MGQVAFLLHPNRPLWLSSRGQYVEPGLARSLAHYREHFLLGFLALQPH